MLAQLTSLLHLAILPLQQFLAFPTQLARLVVSQLRLAPLKLAPLAVLPAVLASLTLLQPPTLLPHLSQLLMMALTPLRVAPAPAPTPLKAATATMKW